MGWTAIENALQSWVATASGLPCIWEAPNATRPAGTYLSIQLGEMTTLGWDQLYGSNNGGGTPGVNDYKETVISLREFHVRVQCFAPAAAGAHTAPPYGDNSARAILSRLQASLTLPSVISAMEAAGTSNVDPGTISYLPALIGAAFEGRGVLDTRFYALESVVGYGTSIQTVAPIGATWNG